jgi:hypothetical protein
MARVKYYLMLVGLAIIGVAGAATELPTMPIRGRVLHTLSDALLIAVFLALTVDAYLKKWLLKEATLDIFQFMIGFQLPRGVTDRIKVLVQDAALIRRDCELRWTLTWSDAKKEEVDVWLEVTYDMENSSHEDKKYIQQTSALDPKLPNIRVEEMWYHSSEVDHDYRLHGDELKKCEDGKEDEHGTKWIRAKQRIIPSRNRERELTCNFGAKYFSRNGAHDDDTYTFTHLTLNASVVVEAPEDLQIKVNPKADRTHLGNRYEYSRLFVDNESVTIRWSKQPPVKGVDS